MTHINLHLTPGDRGIAVADIWRVADGKIVEIVEHCVIQEVPEAAKNDNTMFRYRDMSLAVAGEVDAVGRGHAASRSK